jgi:hypothetical protein
MYISTEFFKHPIFVDFLETEEGKMVIEEQSRAIADDIDEQVLQALISDNKRHM